MNSPKCLKLQESHLRPASVPLAAGEADRIVARIRANLGAALLDRIEAGGGYVIRLEHCIEWKRLPGSGHGGGDGLIEERLVLTVTAVGDAAFRPIDGEGVGAR